jgi:catechol 2,3-dioxygenase-like lactoylglutathione lyase family enzyme
MNKIDPIIAVRDVSASAQWYQSVFGCRRTHGGDDFAVLQDENGEILICLHKWGEHGHPTLADQHLTAGNGLLLYYKTDHLETIRQNIEKMDYPVDQDLHLNPNAEKKEFSFRDPDGYYWTVTEYHTYGG